MNFGEVLTKAWQIIWKNKILWLFGILAGCGTGINNSLGNSSRYSYDSGDTANLPYAVQNFFYQLERFFTENPWVILLLIFVGLVVFLVVIFLGTIGNIGLIRGAARADEGARLSFGELFNDSLRYFWRVFFLKLLVGVAFIIIGIILAVIIAMVTIMTIGLFLICLIPMLCLLVPAGWFISGVVMQATIAIVVEDVGIMEGLQRGWNVVIRNIGPIIVIALIAFLGVGLITLLITAPLMAAAVPFIIGAANNTADGLRTGGIISAVLACIYLPIMVVLLGILTAYTTSLWTLTYRRLTGRGTLPGSALGIKPEPVIPSGSTGATVYDAPVTETSPADTTWVGTSKPSSDETMVDLPPSNDQPM